MSNINIKKLILFHKKKNKLATLTAVSPPARYGMVKIHKNGLAKFKEKIDNKNVTINGGFFVFNKKIFNILNKYSDSLEKNVLEKISASNKLNAFKHIGFWKAKQKGILANFIKLSADTNLKVINFLKDKIYAKIKELKISKKKVKILILGLAYKKNIDDLRESSSLKLIKLLKLNGIIKICYADPFIKKIYTRDFNFGIENIKITPKNLKKFDIVIIMTDHDKFDFKLILKHSKFIIDTRGRFKTSHKVIRG